MQVKRFIEHTYRKWTGKTDYPAVGTDVYKKILDWGNYFIREVYARDPEHNWDSCFEERGDIGTVTADTRTYELDDDITDLSDKVIVTTESGQRREFTVKKARDRNKFSHADVVFKAGRDPVQITFAGVGEMPEELVGGTISAGCYVIPAEVSSPNAVMPVDRPSWVVARVAAELASTDRSREERYPDLIDEANEEYRLMGAANEDLPDDDRVPVEGYAPINDGSGL